MVLESKVKEISVAITGMPSVPSTDGSLISWPLLEILTSCKLVGGIVPLNFQEAMV
mgnify:CR=1 FL=1